MNNNEAENVHHEINRYILLLRTEKDAENFQAHLDKIVSLNLEYKRLYDEKK